LTVYTWADEIKELAMGGCYNMFGGSRNADKIVVRQCTGKRYHLEGVVIDATIILKCLAVAEHCNGHTDLLKYQREVPFVDQRSELSECMLLNKAGAETACCT
jgi:hypothetical protein